VLLEVRTHTARSYYDVRSLVLLEVRTHTARSYLCLLDLVESKWVAARAGHTLVPEMAAAAASFRT